MKQFIQQAKEIAKKSTCQRQKCGAVIVNNNQIIGQGFNSPPSESQRRCNIKKDQYHQKVTDKTCCVHAEQRAIMDALKRNPDKLKGSQLFFMRLDLDNNVLFAGQPYCTICSKMALDVGIKEFILYHKDGIKSYNTEKYNEISYLY